MSSPEELALELSDVAELIQAQCDAGLCREDVLQCVYNSWASRLSACAKFSPKGKTLLTSAIKNGPWDATQKKDLALIILGSSKPVKPGSNRRENQKAHRFENLVDMDTMLKLRDPKFSQVSKKSLLATSARAIGLELPDQPTLYRMVALLAWCDNKQYTQTEVYDHMDDIQKFIKSVPRKTELPYIAHYPASAVLLPEEIKKSAFPTGELPVEVDIPELATVLGNTKMRGREPEAKKQKVPDWLSNVPEEHRATVWKAMQSEQKGDASPSPKQPGPAPKADFEIPAPAAPIADCFRFRAQPLTLPSADVPTPKHDAEQDASQAADARGSDDDTGNGGATANTVDELEQQLVNALKARGSKGSTKKRPAAAAKSTVMKKPAAATGTVLKRPAAAAVAAGGFEKKPAAAARKIPKSSTWKLINSAIYNKVRNELFAKTGDDEKSKEVARAACKRAKAKFLAGTLKHHRLGS